MSNTGVAMATFCLLKAIFILIRGSVRRCVFSHSARRLIVIDTVDIREDDGRDFLLLLMQHEAHGGLRGIN